VKSKKRKNHILSLHPWGEEMIEVIAADLKLCLDTIAIKPDVNLFIAVF